MRARKIYEKLLVGVYNVRFADLCKVVESFGHRLDRVRAAITFMNIPMRRALSTCKAAAVRPNLIKFGNFSGM